MSRVVYVLQHCGKVLNIGSNLEQQTDARYRVLKCLTGRVVGLTAFHSPPCLQVTVVSVASPTPSAPQKSVTLPVNVALGQQILTVQQPTSASPVKVATSQTTAQVRPEPTAVCHKIHGTIAHTSANQRSCFC